MHWYQRRLKQGEGNLHKICDARGFEKVEKLEGFEGRKT